MPHRAIHRRPIAATALLLALPQAPQGNPTGSVEHLIDLDGIAAGVKLLSDDLFEGRGPGSRGDVLTRRYLAVHGPATATDVAHFFGARVTRAKAWLDRLEDELVPVECGDRSGLVALAKDRADLRKKPPTTAKDWPVRLLPLWESMLMGHADKSWTTPVEADRKEVWRKAAFVAAVVLARGRVVATWTQATKGGRLQVTVTPLSGWRKTKHAASVRREAAEVAQHLELKGADVRVED